jgi:hypothetical protein
VLGYMTNSLCSDIRRKCQVGRIDLDERVGGLWVGLLGQIAELGKPHAGGLDRYIEREGYALAER